MAQRAKNMKEAMKKCYLKKSQCRQCDGIFEGRHELHVHQNTQHGGALQNRPWRQEAHLDEPPWGDPVRGRFMREIKT